jgi:hypothetical protein
VSKDNVQCRGCYAIGNQCGTCGQCRRRAKGMYDALIKIAAGADDASPADLRAYVADALEIDREEMEHWLAREEK